MVNASNGTRSEMVEVDVLIIGTGPAGASTAVFLAHYGITNTLMVSKASSTADTPRAHITNASGLECLRDVGLEDECMQVATSRDKMLHTRWTRTFLGEEYARVHAWGNDPEVKGAYEAATPCHHCDIPQTLMEPILVKDATTRGAKIRFDTEFVTFTQDGDSVTSTLRDLVTGTEYQVKSRYLVGADGGRSTIVEQLKIPLDIKPDGGVAINVHFKGDLTPWMSSRIANLTHCFLPDKPAPDYAVMGVLRAIKPWTEWMMIVFHKPGAGRITATDEQYLERTKDLIGEGCPPLELISTSIWIVRETVAEYYSVGRVHCAGDAVHRHPPFNGLGSNTCIQDAYNLAWKLAYTLKGHAGPKLLQSYSAERQPVGAGIIKRANDGFRHHNKLWASLGLWEHPERLAEMEQATELGAQRRKEFHAAIDGSKTEFNALGIEMNQRCEGGAVVTRDEKAPIPALLDPLMIHTPSTYPGCRLPHVWLNTPVPSYKISSLDLAGRGAFTLFTGIGGTAWCEALTTVGAKLQIPVASFTIGWRSQYVDVYRDWERKRGVEEDGCVLVRPDRVVCWRSTRLTDDAATKLQSVIEEVLGL